MRIRIKFTKNRSVRFLGHLDIMRFFQRAFNRAGIKMLYSEGFNPHQKMSFALPLGVGISSRGEYLDAEVADGQSAEDIKSRLSLVCGDGFDIAEVKLLKENADNAMASVKFASYEIFSEDMDLLLTEKYFEQESIIISKKTKSGSKDVDIKNAVIDFKLSDKTCFLFLKAGSEDNIKPELIFNDIYSFSGIEYKRDRLDIVRTDLYADKNTSLIDHGTL